MADGKHCPGCGKDIGVWPIFSAGLPNRIWCPHCHSRLRYPKTAGVNLLVLLVLTSVLVGTAFAAYPLLTDQSDFYILVFEGILFGMCVPIELVTTWFLRNYKELECMGPHHSP